MEVEFAPLPRPGEFSPEQSGKAEAGEPARRASGTRPAASHPPVPGRRTAAAGPRATRTFLLPGCDLGAKPEASANGPPPHSAAILGLGGFQFQGRLLLGNWASGGPLTSSLVPKNFASLSK